jgi:hypothetical protein
VLESTGPNERIMQFTTIIFDKLTIDGYPVQVTVTLQPLGFSGSTIQSISTTHPSATQLQSGLVVSGFGHIEFMQSELSGTRLSIRGLRVRLEDPSKTILEFAAITINGRATESQDTTGREGLQLWLAQLGKPHSRPILVVEGRERTGQPSTIAILSSIAARSRNFDVVPVDVGDESYRDRGVEKLLAEIAKGAGLNARSLPSRAQMGRDRYFRLATDWLVESFKDRRNFAIIILDNIGSAQVSAELHDFVTRLIPIVTRSPNFVLVLLGYSSVDISANLLQYVYIEQLEGSSSPSSHGSGRYGVLVVGTGSYNLPKPVELAAQEVGASIAAAGCTLITGGWPGVDHVVARAFMERRGSNDPPAVDRLVQIVDEPQEPDFKGGSIVRVRRDQSTVESLKRADLVILIGGAGGTWQAFGRALAANKLVLPLMSTGTDARQAAILLECLGQYVPSELLRADFAAPSGPERARRLLLAALRTIDAKAASRAVDNSDLAWMVNNIFPLANEYLRKRKDFDEEAERIWKEFRSHELPDQQRMKLVTALLEEPSCAWRVVGYLAIEAWPLEQHFPLLFASLDKEVSEALERIETRPLWRWLSAVTRLQTLSRGHFGRLRSAPGRSGAYSTSAPRS